MTMDDLITRLRNNYENWSMGSKGPGYLLEAADALATRDARIAELEAEVGKLTKSLAIVQNAAKTIASAQGTELEHLRQNSAYDHKIRAEHESLLERDAMMTDALLAAESRATAAEERLKEAGDLFREIATDCQGASLCGEPENGLEVIHHKVCAFLTGDSR